MADNHLRITAEFDAGPIVAGSQAAVKSFDNIRDAAAQAEKLLASGLGIPQVNSILQNLGYTAKEAAAALDQVTRSEVEAAAASTTAAGGFANVERSAATAAARVLGMEAGFGMAGGAIGRVVAAIPGLSEALAVAFPIAIITAAVEKIQEFRDEQEKAVRESENLAIASYKTADSIELENLKLEDQIEKLEKHPEPNHLRIELLEAKGAAEDLTKSLEESIQKSNDLLNVGLFSQFFAAAAGNEKEARDHLQPIIDEITAARLKLAQAPPGSDAAKAAVEEQIKLYGELNHQLDLEILNMEAAGEKGGKFVDADSIAKLQSMQIGALNASTALAELQKNADLHIDLGNLQDATDALKKYEDAARRMLSEHPEANRAHEAAMHEAEERIKAEEEADRVIVEARRQTYSEMQRIGEQEVSGNIQNAKDDIAAVEDALRTMEQERERIASGHTGIFAQTLGAEEAKRQLVELDTEITKIEQSILRLKADMALPSTDEKGIERYREELRALEAELQKLQQEQLKLQQQSLSVWQKIGQAMETDLQKGFDTFNSQITRMMQTGESFSKVMIRTWNSMVESFIQGILKMAEQWVVTELLKLTTTTTTNQQITAQTLAQNLIQRFDNAKTAASKAMASTPFPLDLVVGPLVFAAALAFKEGGLVPGDQMIYAHDNEMVLPSHISSAIQGAVPSIQSFNNYVSEGKGVTVAAGGSTTSHTTHNRVTVNVSNNGGKMTTEDIAAAVRDGMRRGMLPA